MYSYWFWIGKFPVRTYSTIFALAFLFGLGATLYFSRVYGDKGDTDHWWNLAPIVLVFGIVGARFWQVFFFDWSFYQKNPGQIIAVWNGGLSIQGGLVGAVLAALVYLWRHNKSILHFADLSVPGVILGMSIGRDADFMNASAYGRPTGHNWGVIFPPGTLAHDQYGNQPLWPAVIWEAQVDIILFAILLILFQRKKGWPKGFASAYYVITYSIARFFLEIMRGDSPRFALGWDAAQYTAVVTFVLGIILMVWVFWKYRDDRMYFTHPKTAVATEDEQN
ncbi:prolipoprotein diacylglyceryl transferase [Alicyclobacillus mengziensis]|uniref:Phosphatidylglycerol--prolipoprotein diacylglyceryl transferase n=1 Tax=Alicyclobacillus mengziensis TaxID=2931921 RepID=A0A9X7Z9Q3_9BACL|nr:prolipoprotein diacylglyceryl transferase [Alicyclobacillus mengziensis]